jgi:hypothetical protein
VGLLSSLRKLLQPSERQPGTGERISDRKIDARADMLDGKAMTADGRFIDFESDSEKPGY